MSTNDRFPPKAVAVAVNHSLTPSGIDMVGIFRSIERDYGYNIQASYNGFTVGKPGEKPVYAEGVYRPVQARGGVQCAEYRLRLLKFYIWAIENTPTPEVLAYDRWLHAQL